MAAAFENLTTSSPQTVTGSPQVSRHAKNSTKLDSPTSKPETVATIWSNYMRQYRANLKQLQVNQK